MHTEQPVIEGVFPNGPELMLWRPGLDPTSLRRRALRATLITSPATYAVVGGALVALGAAPVQVHWLFLVVIVALAGYVLVLWVNYECADYDHQHSPNKQCFLDKRRGEYFYRPSDFRSFPPSIVYSVHTIISTVQAVHTSPASTWLAPHHLREVHRVAWDILHALDRTQTLRRLADDSRCQAFPDDLLGARSRLTAVDDALDGVVNYLRQVAFLVQAWEQKLTETELRSHLRAELDTVSCEPFVLPVRRAESLTEEVFAYITAARDVTNAGAFVWERAQR
jgi:hypothetical protein